MGNSSEWVLKVNAALKISLPSLVVENEINQTCGFSFSALLFIFFHFTKQKNLKKFSLNQHFFEIEKNFLAFHLLSKTERLKFIKTIVEKNFICEQTKKLEFFKLPQRKKKGKKD